MTGHVYFMTNRPNGVLYTGVTSDLQGRAWEHREGLIPGFTKRYNCRRLVWFERHPNIVLAIRREKRVKRYRRDWKVELLEGLNPDWSDLFDHVYEIDNPFQPPAGSRWASDYE